MSLVERRPPTERELQWCRQHIPHFKDTEQRIGDRIRQSREDAEKAKAGKEVKQ